MKRSRASEDAFAWFLGTGIEYLAVGNCKQNPALARDYKNAFEPD
ncbi:MAG: hypothetical protein WA231_06360 [Methylocella sp.]